MDFGMNIFSVGENRSNEIERTTSINPSIMGGFYASYKASPILNWIKRSHMAPFSCFPIRPAFCTWGRRFLGQRRMWDQSNDQNVHLSRQSLTKTFIRYSALERHCEFGAHMRSRNDKLGNKRRRASARNVSFWISFKVANSHYQLSW